MDYPEIIVESDFKVKSSSHPFSCQKSLKTTWRQRTRRQHSAFDETRCWVKHTCSSWQLLGLYKFEWVSSRAFIPASLCIDCLLEALQCVLGCELCQNVWCSCELCLCSGLARRHRVGRAEEGREQLLSLVRTNSFLVLTWGSRDRIYLGHHWGQSLLSYPHQFREPLGLLSNRSQTPGWKEQGRGKTSSRKVQEWVWWWDFGP